MIKAAQAHKMHLFSIQPAKTKQIADLANLHLQVKLLHTLSSQQLQRYFVVFYPMSAHHTELEKYFFMSQY